MNTYINFDDVELKKYLEPGFFDWILGLCKCEQWYDFSNVKFYKGTFINIPIKQVEVIAIFNSIHYSNNVIRDLSNICINGLLIISEPHINSLAITSSNKDIIQRKLD